MQLISIEMKNSFETHRRSGYESSSACQDGKQDTFSTAIKNHIKKESTKSSQNNQSDASSKTADNKHPKSLLTKKLNTKSVQEAKFSSKKMAVNKKAKIKNQDDALQEQADQTKKKSLVGAEVGLVLQGEQVPVKHQDKNDKNKSEILGVSSVKKEAIKESEKEASVEMLKMQGKLEVTEASENTEQVVLKDTKGSQTKTRRFFDDVQKNEPIVLVADHRVKVNTEVPTVENSSVVVRQALQETGNAEIVQRAQFVLREKGAGEIHLTLKPESLGTVRINLTLDENRVLGRIVVDSPEVKAAFEDNMADLRHSMQRSGFTMDTLEVSVGQNYHSQQGFASHSQEKQPFYSERLREGNQIFNQIQEAPKADSYRSVLIDMKA